MNPRLLVLILLALPLASALTITAPTSDITAASLPTSVQASWDGNSSSYAVTLADSDGPVDEQNTSANNLTWQLAAGDYTLDVQAGNSSDTTTFSVQEESLELSIDVARQEYEVLETVEFTVRSNRPVTTSLDLFYEGELDREFSVPLSGSQEIIYVAEKAGEWSAVLSAEGQEKTATYTVIETRPLAVDFTHTQPQVNKAATFSASASGGVAPYTYKWLFSDDTAGNGQETDHYFFEAGEHEATLIVTDDEATQKSLTKSFSVVEETYDAELTFRDRNENFIEDLTVELIKNTTDLEQETDETGTVEFEDLLAGNYTLRVTQIGTTYLNETLEITDDTSKLYDLEYGTARNETTNTTSNQNQTQQDNESQSETQEQQTVQAAQPTPQQLAAQELEESREDALSTVRENKFDLRLANNKDAALTHLDLYKRFDQATSAIEQATTEDEIQQALKDVPSDVKISAETSTVSYHEPDEIADAIEAYLDAKEIPEEDRDKHRYSINEHTANVSVETRSYTATITYPDSQEAHTIVEKKITSPPGSTHVEVIDKAFAADVSKLRINGEYDVLQADPILRFTSDEYSYSAQVAAGTPGQTVVVPQTIQEKPLFGGLVAIELGATSLARTGIYLLILGLFVAGIVAGKKLNERREAQHLFEDFYELTSTAVDLAAQGDATRAAALAPDIAAIHQELPEKQRAQSADIVEHLQAHAKKHEFTTTVNQIYDTVEQAGGDINAISSAYEHAIDAYEDLPAQLQQELRAHLDRLEEYLDGHIHT